MSNSSTNTALTVAKTIVMIGLISGGSPTSGSTATTSVRVSDIACNNTSFDSRKRKSNEIASSNNSSGLSVGMKHPGQIAGKHITKQIDKNSQSIIKDTAYLVSHIANPRLKEMYSKFSAEFSKNSSWIKSDHEIAIYRFLSIANKVSTLPYTDVYIQLKEDNAFKFNLYFKNDIEVMLTSPFEGDDELGENDAVYSVFKNDEIISTGIYEINNFIEAFPKYLQV